jgi:molecular chaperone DnaK
VTIRVFQGEREMAADNKLLGQFDLVGIPPAPRGLPQIEVTFDIDANGIVNVSAKDKASGKEQTIRIQASGGLSDADIDRLVREAEAHAGEDKRRRELVEIRNQADAAAYSANKALQEAGDKAPADIRTEIEQAVSALNEAMRGEDVDRIRSGAERVTQAAMRLAEALSQAQAAQASTSGREAQSGNDEVVDAEFEEVDGSNRQAG